MNQLPPWITILIIALTPLIILYVFGDGPVQLPDGSYQVPDDWKGCWVNPDDLNDTGFGCSGVSGPNPLNSTGPAEIDIKLSNGSVVTLVINGTE